MESNIINEHSWSPESPPVEPHFDEEATLLSAQRVVPIERVAKKPGFSRRWLFGFALGGALLLGVAATVLYYSRFNMREAKAVTESETVTSGVQGGQSESQDLKERPGLPEARGFGEEPVDYDTTAQAKVEPSLVSPAARIPGSSTLNSKRPARRAPIVVVESSEYESREWRRDARREAKEWKRAKRERRAVKGSDGVLRIRDIFEGPSRP